MWWLSWCINAVLNIHGADCSCIILGITKKEIINILRNIDRSEEKMLVIKYKFSLSYIKCSHKFWLLIIKKLTRIVLIVMIDHLIYIIYKILE